MTSNLNKLSLWANRYRLIEQFLNLKLVSYNRIPAFQNQKIYKTVNNVRDFLFKSDYAHPTISKNDLTQVNP